MPVSLQVCRGLQAMHSSQPPLAHRDIKVTCIPFTRLPSALPTPVVSRVGRLLRSTSTQRIVCCVVFLSVLRQAIGSLAGSSLLAGWAHSALYDCADKCLRHHCSAAPKHFAKEGTSRSAAWPCSDGKECRTIPDLLDFRSADLPLVAVPTACSFSRLIE